MPYASHTSDVDKEEGSDMKNKLLLLLYLVILVLSLTSPVLAETDAYTLSWWTVDGGGSVGLTSGDYTLSGTIGQPDAGVSSSDNYDLAGGFWAGIMSTLRSFLPLIRK